MVQQPNAAIIQATLVVVTPASCKEENNCSILLPGQQHNTEGGPMALTLAEAAKLSNDVLLTGVIETIIQESPVLQVMPFIEMKGKQKKQERCLGC